jgi:hypothetical protein
MIRPVVTNDAAKIRLKALAEICWASLAPAHAAAA